MLSLDNPFYRFCERLEEDLVKAGLETDFVVFDDGGAEIEISSKGYIGEPMLALLRKESDFSDGKLHVYVGARGFGDLFVKCVGHTFSGEKKVAEYIIDGAEEYFSKQSKESRTRRRSRLNYRR